jgi:hypothetical protein
MGKCCALLRMRTLSISYAERSATIDARCDYFVRPIEGFRGIRPDPGGASDDSKLTGFGCFNSSDKVSDWIASRLAEGPTGVGAWGVDYSGYVSSPRWHCVTIPHIPQQ